MLLFNFSLSYGTWRARPWLLLLLLLACTSSAAQAAGYYWVGGSGQWDDLSHWATSSGGTTNQTQVPQSTDNVYFDANSFTAKDQTVTTISTMTCQDLDWTGAVHAIAGGTTEGARLVGSGTLEVNGDLRLEAGLGRQDANFSLLATGGGHLLDLQAVPVNGWLSFDSKSGGWLFTSDVNLVQYGATPSLLLNAGTIDFGDVTVSCFGVRSTGTFFRDIRLNDSHFNLLAPANTWEVSGTGLTLDAGTSTLRLGPVARATANGYSFVSSAQAYHVVEVAVGTSALLNVGGSSFYALQINGNTTLTSAATITGSLAVGRDVVLRAAAGQVLSFGSTARLTTGGNCAGMAVLLSSVPGQTAFLNRAGGWGGTILSYAAVQDLSFGGGAALAANKCLDRGNNQGATFTPLPVRDFYWVGGSGAWHDPSHWATSSGGSASGFACLPSLATNVHFDANSFGSSGEVVTFDGTNAFCRDLDWTGANAPRFTTAGTGTGSNSRSIVGCGALIG